MYEPQPRAASHSTNPSTNAASSRPPIEPLIDRSPTSTIDRRSSTGQNTRQDRSQVEPLAPPSVPAPLDPPHKPIDGDDAAWALPRLTQLGAQIGSRVEFAPLKSSVGGYYERETKRIVIADSGSINAKVATLVHELAHALVRAEPGDDNTQLTYAEEELVVESVAFSVCSAVGLDTAGSSIPYLTSWAQAAELSTLERTAALIDRLARRIEDVLLEPIPAD